MDHAWLRARLAAAEAIAVPSVSRDAHDLTDTPPVPAAVLIPLIAGSDGGVLLTKRTAHLSRHAGQISFPGGRIDPQDASAEAAALREAWEEIALDPVRVEIVGRLGDYLTGTGYQVTPIIGLLAADTLATLTPSPHEVDSVFVLPMAVLLDPAAPSRRHAEFRGRQRSFWVWPHPEHDIWGATAAILVDLATRLRDGLSTGAADPLENVPES